MKKWVGFLILVFFIFLPMIHVPGQEKFLNPGELYDSSITLYYKGKYDEAIEGFSKIVQSVPTSTLVSYSQYMIGLCYLKMGKYEEAVQQLELYVKTYPDGDRIREAEKGIQIAKEYVKEKSSYPLTAAQPFMKKIPREGKDPKRRICAQISHLEGKNLEEVEKRVKELKNAGVNTILFRVFQNKGDRVYKFVATRQEEGVYFKTEHAPIVDDILGNISEIAHRNGLDIFAWVTTRYAHFGPEGPPEYRCKRYNFETRKIEIARGFNLFHPDVLKRLEGLFRDLGRYPIEGILFQDDLILYHNEDFSAEANQSFLKEFGYLPHPDIFYINPYQSESGKYYTKGYTDRFRSWANWKNRWLMNVAQQLMKAARETNPNLQFALNLYFEAILDDFNGMAWFSQTLSEALKNDFDYYAVMAYHRQAMRDRKIDLKEAMELMAVVAQKVVRSVGNPSKVLMKVQIFDWKNNEILPPKEVEGILNGILNHGEVSLAFFPYIEKFPLHSIKGKWVSPSK
ncbi:MAG: tetratricopeptide repeat protein [Syntrophaceae bacterium]|nr:tetratricopeptide repeat protein [Syntrophaceae bacterium]